MSLQLKPSQLTGVRWRSFYGCCELAECLHDAIVYLACNGDAWDLPIPRPDVGNSHVIWNWDHGHPDGTRCQFHAQVLDACGRIKSEELTRMTEYLAKQLQ